MHLQFCILSHHGCFDLTVPHHKSLRWFTYRNCPVLIVFTYTVCVYMFALNASQHCYFSYKVLIWFSLTIQPKSGAGAINGRKTWSCQHTCRVTFGKGFSRKLLEFLCSLAFFLLFEKILHSELTSVTRTPHCFWSWFGLIRWFYDLMNFRLFPVLPQTLILKNFGVFYKYSFP